MTGGRETASRGDGENQTRKRGPQRKTPGHDSTGDHSHGKDGVPPGRQRYRIGTAGSHERYTIISAVLSEICRKEFRSTGMICQSSAM